MSSPSADQSGRLSASSVGTRVASVPRSRIRSPLASGYGTGFKKTD
jgi:hypothetical protein